MLRGGKPVALFIDEAHDLHGKILNGLKRLMEVIARDGDSLSVALIGHPKLRNDLRRPTMEEICHRTDILSFEGLGEDARAYLDWLIEPACPGPACPPIGHAAAVCRIPQPAPSRRGSAPVRNRLRPRSPTPRWRLTLTTSNPG